MGMIRQKFTLFMRVFFFAAIVLVFANAALADSVVVLETNYGKLKIALNEKKAPISTKNFLAYVNNHFYDGLIFHRVIPGFMVQGGGFKPGMMKVKTKGPIVNEADNGLKNTRGSLAMARTSQQDSATSQFFINLKDNAFLDHGVGGFGYAVFGQVVEGLDIIDKIAKVKTGQFKQFSDVPIEDVIITKAYRVDKLGKLTQ